MGIILTILIVIIVLGIIRAIFIPWKGVGNFFYKVSWLDVIFNILILIVEEFDADDFDLDFD